MTIAGARAARSPAGQDRVDVDVGGHQVGHQVQLRVAPRGDVDVVGDDESCRPAAAAVSASHSAASRRCRAGRASACRDRGPTDSDTEPVVIGGSRDLAVVDLVAAQRGFVAAQRLVRREHDVGVEQAEAVDAACAGLHRVVDAAAQHLEAAADAQHRPARRGVRDDAVGQAAVAQPVQVGDGRLAAREHDEVGVGAGRRGRSPSAPAPRARRPAPRRRWSWRCAAAGSPPPAATARRAAAAARPTHAVGEHRHRVLGVEPQAVIERA